MGEAVPIAYIEGPEAQFAAYVIAAYFGEQMGRETRLVPGATVTVCLDMLRSGRSPMAVLDMLPENHDLAGLTVVDPVLPVGGKTGMLVMGEEASKQLQFSLVPMYMEKLENRLSFRDWETGLARVRFGEGARKVALEMLREKDLI
jgi:hypothetical protein